MADELVFHTNPVSRGRIVGWMPEEVGCPSRTEVLPYGPAMKASAFRAGNPWARWWCSGSATPS